MGTPNLWNNPKSHVVFNQNEKIIQGHLFKRSRQTNNLVQHFFVLTKSKLFILRSEEDPRILKEMSAEWVRVEFPNEPSPIPKPRLFCIRFTRGHETRDVYAAGEQTLEKWKEGLAKTFIQTDFNSTFSFRGEMEDSSSGKMYLIQNKVSKELFVCKPFLKSGLTDSSSNMQILTNEICAMRHLDHPQMLRLEFIYDSGDAILLILQYPEGGTLRNLLLNWHILDNTAIKSIMNSLLQGLAYLELKGIIHRNLSFSSILLNDGADFKQCEVLISDFGHSSFVVDHCPAVKFCGVPGFIAPEIFNYSDSQFPPYTHKSDVFSAGVIFYTLFFGKEVFGAKTISEVLKKNMEGTIHIDKNSVPSNRDKQGLDLLERLLEKNPMKRISAWEALFHPFFQTIDRTTLITEALNREKNMESVEMILQNLQDQIFDFYLVTPTSQVRGSLMKKSLPMISNARISARFSQVDNIHQKKEKWYNRLINKITKNKKKENSPLKPKLIIFNSLQDVEVDDS